jgi:hypothetical protein
MIHKGSLSFQQCNLQYKENKTTTTEKNKQKTTKNTKNNKNNTRVQQQ